MALDLFQMLDDAGDKVGITDLGDLRSEFLTTHACGEEGNLC